MGQARRRSEPHLIRSAAGKKQHRGKAHTDTDGDTDAGLQTVSARTEAGAPAGAGGATRCVDAAEVKIKPREARAA